MDLKESIMKNTQNEAVKEDEGKQPVELPATEKPVEVSAPPEAEAGPAEAEGKLPEEVKERTREEFEKLKAKNKELADKLTTYEGPKPKKRSALDVFAPQEVQQVPTPQVPPQFAQQAAPRPQEEIKPVVPDENGYIDINVLNQTIAQINERNKRIEQQAALANNSARKAEDRISKYEHTEQTLKTYEKHPYLDPNNVEVFDEKFSDLVTLEIIRQMTQEGVSNYLKAANKVKDEYYDPTKKVQAPPDEKQKENVAKRDQINAISGVQKGEKEPEQEYLVSESRRGSRDAVYQRLKKSGY
jgi:hypothetical protein